MANKIRRVKRFLRGWARNRISVDWRKKHVLLEQLDVLDRKAKLTILGPQEIELRYYCLKGQLNRILREEEIY